MYSTPQKMVVEFLGTFALVFLGAGSICADQMLKAGGGAGVGLVGIALAHGLALGVMITAMGHISGGHLNPAVTIGFWVSRKMGTFEGLAYWVAQLLGGIAAAYLLTTLFPEEVWRTARLGTPALVPDLPVISGIMIEAVLTFFVVAVVFGSAADPKGGAKNLAGFAIGLTYAAGILMGGPITGAAMNPARALGPALAAKAWAHHGVYWVGPLLGGALAGWLYSVLFMGKSEES
jgi:aquaporin Z